MWKRLSEAERVKLVELCRKGWTVEAAARELGVSTSGASKILKQRGVRLEHGPGHKLTPQEEANIVSRFANGESIASIAKDYSHVHPTTLRNTLDRHGVDPVTRPAASPEQISRALDIVRRGRTVHEAAEAAGLSDSTVARALRKARAEGTF